MKRYLAALAAASMVFAGCTSDSSSSGKRGMTNMETGALIGAVGGAAVGAVAYKKNRTAGAIVGAVGGGLAGGAVGAYMDSQKKDLEKNLHKEIQAGSTRVDKMPNDVVRITMTNQTAFDTNSTTVKPGFYTTMDKVGDVVTRYGKTTLTIVGHTDTRACGVQPEIVRAAFASRCPLPGIEGRQSCAPRDIGQGLDRSHRQQRYRSRSTGKPPRRNLCRAGTGQLEWNSHGNFIKSDRVAKATNPRVVPAFA